MAYQVSTVSQYALGQLEKKLQGIFIIQTVFQNYANLFMLTKICAGVMLSLLQYSGGQRTLHHNLDGLQAKVNGVGGF